MSSISSWSELREAVLAVGSQAVGVMACPEVGTNWDEPSVLSDMTVGMLATHINQMVGFQISVLSAEAPDADEVRELGGLDGYTSARMPDGEPAVGSVASVVRGLADEGAKAGHVAVVEEARTRLEVLRGLLDTATPDRLVPSAVTPGAAAPLESYLRTRCVEFVVHADDIAASVGLPEPMMDPVATAIAVEALVQMCRERAGDAEVLRALARSERAQPGTLRAL